MNEQGSESSSGDDSLHNGPTSIWLPRGEDADNTVSTLRGEDETTSMNDTFALSIGSDFSNSVPGTSDLRFSKRLSGFVRGSKAAITQASIVS